MSKKIILGIIALITVALSVFLLSPKDASEINQEVFSKTISVSKQYLSLRYKTDNVLINAKNYTDYSQWNSELTSIIEQWKELENDTANLEKLATGMAEEKVGLKLISEAIAYDKQEISNVFDKAPAGKKIATLAKYLGVDAKRAHAILTQDQAQVTADAWNQAGDTFQRLETSAIVIKDGCKVAGFVGTIALTGGTSAIAAGSTLSKAAVLISGADLALEVTDDGAKIALGNNNKLSAIVGDVRTVTEPVASILMIADLPKNLSSSISKLNAVTFGADQLNSTIQMGTVIGIKLPAYSNDFPNQSSQVSVLTPDEVDSWVTEQGSTTTPETIEEIENVLEINKVQNQENQTPTEKQKDQPTEENNDSLSNTVWVGTLQNTAGGSQEVFTHEWNITLNKNGTLSGKAGESEIKNWKKEGDTILVFKEDTSIGYLQFQLSNNTLTLTQIVLGKERISAGQEYMGGKAISGTLTRQ